MNQAPELKHLLDRLPQTALVHEGRSYGVKVVSHAADWPALESIWDPLLRASPDYTVFQSYEYQRLWWQHFGGGAELCIVLILDDAEVVGLAPLQIRRLSYGFPCRKLAFIGTRWEVDRPTFLFARERAALARVLAAFLVDGDLRWDLCELHEQPAGSALLVDLEEAFRSAGLLLGISRDADCPYLVAQGSFEDLLAGKSQRFRKNLKAAERKLDRIGRVEYREHAAFPQVLAELDAYRALEARSWKAQTGVGVARSERYFAFYKDVAETFGRSGDFRVRTLSVDDRVIAGTFGIAFDDVYYSLQIAHDRAFDRCSPGTLLEAREIEQWFAAGQSRYEFLGGFLKNKARWTSTYRSTKQLQAYRPSPFMRVLHFVLCRVRPRVKEWVRPFMKSWRANRMEDV